MEILGFLLGSVLGSFVLALADRSLTNKSFWGRSYCPNCKRQLTWYDLFPIFSYLILKGRCRFCKKRIKKEYLIVEVVMGFLIGFMIWQSKDNFPSLSLSSTLLLNPKLLIPLMNLVYKTFFIVVLMILFITDLRKMLIPNRIILPSLAMGFFLSLGLTIYKISYLYFYLKADLVGKYLIPPHSDYFVRHALITTESLLGGIIMGLLIGGFFWFLIIVTKGKGMGGGDVKLGAFIGLMLGFPQGLLAIMLSFIIGAIFSVGLLVLGKKRFGQTIPFGPFLVIGSLISLYWGNIIIDWYLLLSFKF